MVVDYTLSETLNPAHLASLAAQPHLLSMMLNSSEDGSYNIRFFGSNEAEGVGLVKDDAPIEAFEIKDYLAQARSAMHKVAWIEKRNGTRQSGGLIATREKGSIRRNSPKTWPTWPALGAGSIGVSWTISPLTVISWKH